MIEWKFGSAVQKQNSSLLGYLILILCYTTVSCIKHPSCSSFHVTHCDTYLYLFEATEHERMYKFLASKSDDNKFQTIITW